MSPNTVFALTLASAVGIGLLGGFVLAILWYGEERRTVTRDKAKLQAELDAIEATKRLNAAFWQARAMMRDEVMRAASRPPTDWNEG